MNHLILNISHTGSIKLIMKALHRDRKILEAVIPSLIRLDDLHRGLEFHSPNNLYIECTRLTDSRQDQFGLTECRLKTTFESFSYDDLYKGEVSEDALLILLSFKGYLTTYSTEETARSPDKLFLRAPNHEIRGAWGALLNPFPKKSVDYLATLLINRDKDKALEYYFTLMENFSSHDLARGKNSIREQIFHVIFLTVLFLSSGQEYEIISNIESGDGRPDIVLYKKNELPQQRHLIIIEFKAEKQIDDEKQAVTKLKEACETALNQIHQKNYHLRYPNFERATFYGFAFMMKKAWVQMKTHDDYQAFIRESKTKAIQNAVCGAE